MIQYIHYSHNDTDSDCLICTKDGWLVWNFGKQKMELWYSKRKPCIEKLITQHRSFAQWLPNAGPSIEMSKFLLYYQACNSFPPQLFIIISAYAGTTGYSKEKIVLLCRSIRYICHNIMYILHVKHVFYSVLLPFLARTIKWVII